MHQDYILADPWRIIEEGFEHDRVKSSESLFSLGNGAMGQRANFEEAYSGPTFQGSYIAGVYYPDKTRVGWWKNGYPEYFAKVLNAPNWIGIDVTIDGELLDLNTCTIVDKFQRELNMYEGWYKRSFEATLPNGKRIGIDSTRFLSLTLDEVGAINFEVTALEEEMEIVFVPYLDAGITNEDSNWDDKFWETTRLHSDKERAFIKSYTLKTQFHACTFMANSVWVNGKVKDENPSISEEALKVSHSYAVKAEAGSKVALLKLGGYVTDRNHSKNELASVANQLLDKAEVLGWDGLLKEQQKAWKDIWDMSDITIEGDVKAQQAIRYNIFQLNQTYLGTDSRLNIGPKGFTGEKYGGSTYWDTEAYCIPFYMATKDQHVARNLLQYRFNHLEKAIENGALLGFTNGAALYPMVTMNGEECHNEWEITFEEIHRNGAIAFAIYNYERFTGDYSYIPEMGLEVLIGIARFWRQRATYSAHKGKYVILGVTGPNEYENNVNNNWYTNYLAQWCLRYTAEQINKVREGHPDDFSRIEGKVKLDSDELNTWLEIADKMYFPYSETEGIFLQQDGFLDKELIPVSDLDASDRPINQKWSWDRILRSPYIKQADVLQGMYFFEEQFSEEELEKHFDYYEPFTVHESSLSPCVHSILASRLGKADMAYQFYLRTSRLDLDDYNKEVEEGLHITSMAGTWMSIVEGFGGMRIRDDKLCFDPNIPEEWKAYSFKVNFRNRIIKVSVTHDHTSFQLDANEEMSIRLKGERVVLKPREIIQI
ncbi:MAG: glycoside hydrolase family 65 protein [Eudoraea sp.]|nr:glycoside hydrolase family 65 protein [Eudoraea sp.]